MLEDQAVQNSFDDVAFIVGHVADGLELKSKFIRRTSLCFIKDQGIQAYVKGSGQAASLPG